MYLSILYISYSTGVELCYEADRRDPLITKGNNMNGYTKEIAELLNISIEEAKKVQDYLEVEIGIDYSECTQREFVLSVKLAASEMKAA